MVQCKPMDNMIALLSLLASDSRRLRMWFDNLKIALDKRGISQADLSRMLDVSRATVSNWLSGNRTPSYANLVRISKAVGMPISELLGEDVVIAESRQEHDLIKAMRQMSEHDRDMLLKMAQAISDEED